MINTRLSKSVLTILFILGWAQVAMAHVEGGQATGFMTGFHHPWSGLDHILAMIAVGLWGAQLGSPALWLLPIAFPMMMAMDSFARCRDRYCPFCVLSGDDDFGRGAPEAGPRGSDGRHFCHLPRACARHRITCGAERASVQHGIRDCHGLSSRRGHRTRPGQWVAGGQIGTARRRFVYRRNGHVFSLEIIDMKNHCHLTRSHKGMIAAFGLLFWTSYASAHLVTTGLGPVYDGIGHLVLTPEDFVPVLAIALFAGLRGACSFCPWPGLLEGFWVSSLKGCRHCRFRPYHFLSWVCSLRLT